VGWGFGGGRGVYVIRVFASPGHVRSPKLRLTCLVELYLLRISLHRDIHNFHVGSHMFEMPDLEAEFGGPR
jgi:hypothetical protein